MGAKDLYRAFLNISTKIFGAPYTKKLDARIRFHRKLNLKNPSTLADKVSYMELFESDPLKVKCTDKYAVRDYVIQKGWEEILVPLCHGVCEEAEQIDFDALPNQFAMKATHGCGMNLICEDKKLLTEDQVRRTASQWLEKEYGRACIEPHYKQIPHRIIFEKFLQNADQIIDYKFHCIHGKPDFILVCSNRVSGLKLDVYSPEWELMDIVVDEEKGNGNIERPLQLEKMLEIAASLSADFSFVRVDLYEIEGKIYFGELTFSPATGVFPSFHEDFLEEKGKLLQLSK